MWRLKNGEESFQVVDGPFAGRRFGKGCEYEEIPEQERRRFERVPSPGKRSSRKKASAPAVTTAASNKNEEVKDDA